MMLHENMLKPLVVVCLVPLLTSCSSMQWSDRPGSVLPLHSENQSIESGQPGSGDPQDLPGDQPKEVEPSVYPGTGRFIRSSPIERPVMDEDAKGDITLNFQNTDVQQVIKVVLGDILSVNYTIDPQATGKVNLQTSQPVAKASLLPMLETILQINNLALVVQQDGYQILPYERARHATAPRTGRRAGPGFGVQVIPLHYISAAEMQKILAPVAVKDAFLLVDDQRNLLMLAGTSQELGNWLETIRLFDVDWLEGQSVALYPLENTNADEVIPELQTILGTAKDGADADAISIQPLERLNALLVVTTQKHYLEKVKRWIERLDHAGVQPGKGLYVYKVKNRKASDLAEVINNLFASSTRTGTHLGRKPTTLAPGLEAVTLMSRDDKKAPTTTESRPAKTNPLVISADSVDVRVVADTQKNAILVMASAEDYRVIESALKRLDTTPLQVMIEVSIVDVILTDDLRYGFEWFFKNNRIVDGATGIGRFDLGTNIGLAAATGFSYSLVNSAGTVQAVLNALAEESKINVISSPSLMVLDNNTAEIQVGNQQPVRTATAETEAGTVLETIEFKDTGVRFTVTPSVNPGGLVTMEVNQEVTDVGDIDSATGQRSFLKRQVKSTVAVNSGQTIVLGGLITENDTQAESGIPGLYKLPLIGKLFGTTTNTNTRNELLILLTPSVVVSQKDATGVLNEYRQRMQSLRKDWVSAKQPG